jgi:hypothetical protein
MIYVVFIALAVMLECFSVTAAEGVPVIHDGEYNGFIIVSDADMIKANSLILYFYSHPNFLLYLDPSEVKISEKNISGELSEGGDSCVLITSEKGFGASTSLMFRTRFFTDNIWVKTKIISKGDNYIQCETLEEHIYQKGVRFELHSLPEGKYLFMEMPNGRNVTCLERRINKTNGFTWYGDNAMLNQLTFVDVNTVKDYDAAITPRTSPSENRIPIALQANNKNESGTKPIVTYALVEERTREDINEAVCYALTDQLTVFRLILPNRSDDPMIVVSEQSPALTGSIKLDIVDKKSGYFEAQVKVVRPSGGAAIDYTLVVEILDSEDKEDGKSKVKMTFSKNASDSKKEKVYLLTKTSSNDSHIYFSRPGE